MHKNQVSILGDENLAHLDRVVDYIQNHYSEDLSLNKLAEVAHFSKYYFHRLFREHFNETVHDYIIRVRLEQAAQRLRTDLYASVAQIADACGFSSSQNFARSFTAQFGIAPSSVRKNRTGIVSAKCHLSRPERRKRCRLPWKSRSGRPAA